MRLGKAILPIVSAVLSVSVPSAAGTWAHEPLAAHTTVEPAMVTALREKGAQILALGERGVGSPGTSSSSPMATPTAST